MGIPTPKGYSTLQEVKDYLDIENFTVEEARVANVFLKAVESMIESQTGGRVFVPTTTTLQADVDVSQTTLTVDSALARYPDSGVLLLEDELVTYTGINETDTEPEVYTFTGLTRGEHGTTAAAHVAGVVPYLAKGFRGENSSLYPGDFVELITMWWNGASTWSEISSTNYVAEPLQALPKQYINMGGEVLDTSLIYVAAVWGYADTTPYVIKVAAWRIFEELWTRKGSPGGNIVDETVEGHRVKYADVSMIPADVTAMLDSYRRVQV